MLLALVKDVRVVLVDLAWQLVLMRRLSEDGPDAEALALLPGPPYGPETWGDWTAAVKVAVCGLRKLVPDGTPLAQKQAVLGALGLGLVDSPLTLIEDGIGLPNGTTMTIGADGDFDFPNGTVIVKNFRLGGNLIETRHLMRHPDGAWAGYTYEWNAAGTEATRVRNGKVVNVDGQDWIYPSEAECLQCHTAIAGRALGPETAQLNKDFTYPQTGRTANQLRSSLCLRFSV